MASEPIDISLSSTSTRHRLNGFMPIVELKSAILDSRSMFLLPCITTSRAKMASNLYLTSLLIFSFVVISCVFDLPLPISPAPTTQINSYTPYTWYASTAYCNPTITLPWSCGSGCSANPTFEPIAVGGDGSFIQYWYVGYDPILKEVIVAHQGTKPEAIIPLLTDATFFPIGLELDLYPGLNPSIKAHSGFVYEHAKTAQVVLDSVKAALTKFNATSVVTVGHSLGAAISLLDVAFLPLHLPSTISFKSILYGLPRVGNQEFADYIDATAHVTHINHRQDPIPIVPGMFLGFVHPIGEFHIEDSGEWAICPGQDNPSSQCIVGNVPTIFKGNIADHDGPYNNIIMGCQR